jgi:hypothetical protein
VLIGKRATARNVPAQDPTFLSSLAPFKDGRSVVMPRVFFDLKNACRTGARLDFPPSICDIRVP